MVMRTHIRDIIHRHFDAEIIELENGKKLYSYLENADISVISLILLDIILPDKNGMEIAKQLNLSNVYRAIPVIVMSSNINRDTVLLSLQIGVKDVLVKPINEDDFVRRVTKVINESNTQICHEEKKAVHDFLDVLKIEMKKADRGKYPLTISLMRLVRKNTLDSPLTGLDCQQNLENGSRVFICLKNALRETDSIIALSSLEYLAILPFTGEGGADIVNNKLSKLDCEIEMSHLSLIVSSVTYSQQGESVEELVNNLERKYKSLLVVKTLNFLSEL
jgi:response regulator of citrate/malate metabolism